MTESDFPPTHQALQEPNGLLAVGGDLSPGRLLQAYSQGIFPWFSAGEPVLWWSPDPRLVLLPSEFKVSKSLAKSLRNRNYLLSTNREFQAVIKACAGKRENQPGTWILPEMQSAYTALHELGIAHSIEVWLEGELVGGLYGVCLGRAFFGESMFSLRPDSSKSALAGLAWLGRMGYFDLIDCQVESAHLVSLGARAMDRPAFERMLAGAITGEMDRVYQFVENGTAQSLARPVWCQALPEVAHELLGGLGR